MQSPHSDISYVKRQLNTIYQQMCRSQYAPTVSDDCGTSTWLQTPATTVWPQSSGDSESVKRNCKLEQTDTGNFDDVVANLLPEEADSEKHNDVLANLLPPEPDYSSGRPIYQCTHCTKQFMFVSHFRQHVRSHIRLRPFSCTDCDKAFIYKSNLVDHMRTHTGEQPFACNLCGTRFKQSGALSNHMRVHNAGRSSAVRRRKSSPIEYQTDEDEGAESTADLVSSLLAAEALSQSQSFEDGSQLHVESSEHQPLQPISTFLTELSSEPQSACSISQETAQQSASSFSSNPATTTDAVGTDACGVKSEPIKLEAGARSAKRSPNARSKTGGREFKCPECNKAFLHASNLTEHLRIHSNEKPYICSVCGRAFRQAGQLKTHQRTHASSKDAKTCVICSICDSVFDGMRALRRHNCPGNSQSLARSHRSGAQTVSERKLLLKIAARKAESKRLIKSERQNTVDRPYVCCHCEKAFRHVSGFKLHIGLHESMTSADMKNLRIRDVTDRTQKRSDASEDQQSSDDDTVCEWPNVSEDSESGPEQPQFSCRYCTKTFMYERSYLRHCNMHKRKLRAKLAMVAKLSKRSRQAVDHDANKLSAAVLDEAIKLSSAVLDKAIKTVPDKPVKQRTPRASRSSDSVSRRQSSEGDEQTTAGRSRRKIGRPRSTGEKRTYTCEECGQDGMTASMYYYHRRSHSTEKPFACAQCPRRFIVRAHLVEHERIHTGERPFACELCPSSFTQSSGLRQHRASHHATEAEFECPTCAMKFTTPWRLRTHRRAAHDENPSGHQFHCEVCGKTFSIKQSWTYHMLAHSGEKSHECTLCHKRFLVIGQLRQHLRSCEKRAVSANGVGMPQPVCM